MDDFCVIRNMKDIGDIWLQLFLYFCGANILITSIAIKNMKSDIL